MKPSLLKETGSILIEALVALVVVSVGTFGIMKLNTVLLSGTGLSKTRAEALQIAQNRMETIRNFSVEAGCPTVDTGSTETNAVTGVNAVYKVGRTISSVLSERVNIEIYVGWDGVADPHNSAADKRIVLSSVVACMGTGTSGMVAGTANASNAGKLKAPTGAARVGGRDNPTCIEGSCITTINNTNGIPDNTKVYKTGNLVELVDTVTNKVLLTVEDGTDFSTISGRVYIETNTSGVPIVDPDGTVANDGTASSTADDTVFVLSSDASYCARIFPSDAASIIPAGQSGNGIKYRYFDYNCYVGAGWWGNIGIARIGTAPTGHRICLGDPASNLNSETSIWSRKDQLSTSRGYRGYKKIDPNGSNTDSRNFETKGIGYKPTNLAPDGVTWVYVAEHIGVSDQHDFLVADIGNNPNVTCEESGKMELVSSQFTSNQGRFFCMSGQCPDLIATPSTPTTIIHGTITKETGAVLTAPVVGSNSSCTSVTWTDNGGSYSYSCTLNWTGFSGSAWQGVIPFGASGTSSVCPSGAVAAALPVGNSVAVTPNNSQASVNPNSLAFTDVPLAVTDVTIDFKAAARWQDCGLGQPFPTWPPGTSNSALSWPAILGGNPTQYKIHTCTSNSTLTSPCTLPTTGSTPQSGLSYQPDFTGGTKTVCIGITATDGSGALTDSEISSTKCVSKSGSTYNHF